MKLIALLLLALLALPACCQLVYSSRVYQTTGKSWIQLWELNVATGQRTQLTSSARQHLRPGCVASGVVFESGSEPVEPVPPVTTERWLWNRATGKEKLLGKLQPPAPAAKAVAKLGQLSTLAPNGRKAAYFTPDLKSVIVAAWPSRKELWRAAAPPRSDRWNFPVSILWSPDSSRLLVEGEAGNSTAHYLDLWLLDTGSSSWQYLAGGNDPAWSADSKRLFYTTPRNLAPLPASHRQVWITELRMITFPAGTRQKLVSGLSYNAFPAWCGK